jgi:hypothetical protein
MDIWYSAYGVLSNITVTDPMPQEGVWYHVAGTYNGSEFVVYVNGEEAVTVASAGKSMTSTHFTVGSFGSERFDGILDEARFYTNALSAAEIQAIYNATK